jgi:diaminopimelate epimerase
MKVKFHKYQGTGNDFVMIDNRAYGLERDNKNLVESLCHRRFGIGADGLILLQEKEGYDFEMVYFNSDGSESSMCGNGGRCIIQFAKEIGVIENTCSFVAIDGPHEGLIDGNGIVTLKMKDVSAVESSFNDFVLNTGSPHYVRFLNSIDVFNVVEEAKKIRYSNRFAQEGINVNFVAIKDENHIAVRTYERGVEDETYSCGTGVVASSMAHYLKSGKKQNHIFVDVLGGKLQVKFFETDGIFTEVFLIGSAVEVFEGEVEI